jgi:hypothetical protein
MKILFFTCLLCLGQFSWAQTLKLESIYRQIPQPPEKFKCDNKEYYNLEMDLFESLRNQLGEMKLRLEEEMKVNGDKTYNAMTAGFPTAEELKRVDKLSEKEQQAFWQKIENDQAKADEAIARNIIKYQEEKERLNQQIAQHQDKLLTMSEELGIIHYNADNVISDKRQTIWDTCLENNRLTEYGEQQMTKIRIEYCNTISTALLKKIRFEYNFLKQQIAIVDRLTAIEILQYSNLSEEVVYEQNAALLVLSEVEILSHYIDAYTYLYGILPGEISNP